MKEDELRILAAQQLASVLDEVSQNLKDGTCHVSNETVAFAIDLLTNRELSQEEAQRMLNMSRYSFENAIERGEIPDGKRRSARPSKKVWFSWEIREIIRRSKMRRNIISNS